MTTPLTFEEILKRYLYIGNSFGAYLTPKNLRRQPKLEKKVLDGFAEEEKLNQFLKIIKEVNDNPLFIKRINLNFLIAFTFYTDNVPDDAKLTIRREALNLCKTDEDFFYIIRYFTCLTKKHNRFPKRLSKLTKEFYSRKSINELANSIVRHSSHFGWKHRDLLRMAHFKYGDKDAREYILKYVFTRQIDELQDIEDDQPAVCNFLRKSHELKYTGDPDRSATLIREVQADYKEINSELLKKEKIWEALMPQLSLNQLLLWLPKFYKLNLFKVGSPCLNLIMEILVNQLNISRSHIHPLEVFIHIKNFEKGGKPMNSKLVEHLKKTSQEVTRKEIKLPQLMNQLNKCLMLSYCNVEPIGKKILIAIDKTDRMRNTCHHNKNIVALEAAYAIVKWITKVEKKSDVSVGVFQNNEFKFIDVSRAHTYQAFNELLQQEKSDYSIINTAMNTCADKKQPVEIFINLLSTFKCSEQAPKDVLNKLDKPWICLNKYRKKMVSPYAKMVNIFLTTFESCGTDGQRGILDILGFTKDCPRILEAFCRGHFC